VITDIDINSEPLPGYRLIEHLGAGGYGDVWRAEAPGGLIKAIKFIFGQQHEKRASNELRALEHVRTVRHPFLLSLERIEVVNGRLLVVTELADASLKDRFEVCRREGLRGVPRDELLRYLRDAADALDFMSESHALQHLDIKPENLLLLAGHVKVADFGLVKDVRQSQASLVGGMTPLYAAPEVFRGTPSRHSDQYSLAIVYQEMLSGTLPFGGSSVAELTLQHLNDEPDLSSLSDPDRYVVSRALAKDSEHRYATCRDFIDALLSVAASSPSNNAVQSASFAGSATFAEAATRETTQANFFGEEEPANWNARAEGMFVELPPNSSRMCDLPPVELAGLDTRQTPTLVLGIGGTAARILSHLRSSIYDQFGAGVPAVQFLLLDTDARVLSETGRRHANALTPEEVLNLPLRRPQHYRENSQQLLHWLSRRWLYNIPRSLRTEGLRPLGRLALADHARQAGQRIRRALVQSLEPGAIAQSNALTGHEYRGDSLRVFVVTSIAGGTGSGMVLDIGYAVRAILLKLNLAAASIIGIMVHSTGRDARYSELARVNAYSWLTEFQHFQKIENPYPGDISCGLPAHPAGVPAFDHTYLVHLGENLESAEFDQATQVVAEYLRLNTVTKAGTVFDACRGSAGACKAELTGAANLRTMGLFRHTAVPAELCDTVAALVSQRVLAQWRGPERMAPPANGETGASTAPAATNSHTQLDPADAQFIRRLQLDAKSLATNARSLVELELGNDPPAFLSAWFNKELRGRCVEEPLQLKAIDGIFGMPGTQATTIANTTMLGQAVIQIVSPLADKLRAELRRWVMRRVDEPGRRLGAARESVEWVHGHLGQIETELQQSALNVAEKLTQMRARAGDADASARALRNSVIVSQRATEYFGLRIDYFATAAARCIAQVLVAEAKAMSDEITALGREIDQITGVVRRAASAGHDDSGVESKSGDRARVEPGLQARLPGVAAEVDAQLQAEYLDANGGLAKTIMQGGRPRAQLTAKLHEVSRQAAFRALAGAKVSPGPTADAGSSSMTDMRSALASATPAILEHGGQRRVLAIVPGESADAAASSTQLAEELGTQFTLVTGSSSNFTLCAEADGLSLPHVALDIVEGRRDRIEFAGRIHCRTDIVWNPLVSASSPDTAAAWGDVDAGSTQSQQVMCKTLVM
jgi:eukaryotic-like serine/threonine-protein kinase